MRKVNTKPVLPLGLLLTLSFVVLSCSLPVQDRTPPSSNGASAPAADQSSSPPAPMVTSILVSFWTDTDDKDSDEFVSVNITLNGSLLGYGGPWGRGELWGEQEEGNKGQAHTFQVPIIPTSEAQVHQIQVEVIKSESGGHGGKAWHPRIRLGYTLTDGTEHWTVQTGTIRLGMGQPAVWVTKL